MLSQCNRLRILAVRNQPSGRRVFMSVPRTILREDFDTPRIIKGNWQIADDHSDFVDDDALFQHMSAFVDTGITAFDCGDIYYGVEQRIGDFIRRFRRERGQEAARAITVHTKFCPAFLQKNELAALTRRDIESVIDRSLKRLGTERLDLVQMHWWDYQTDGNVDAALILEDLKRAGKIHHIGGTNYNVAELSKMVEAGADIVVNQVQFSPIDRRPLAGMTEYCRAHNIGLVCYGSMAGGLLSSKWAGVADPGEPAFENVSLDKYYRIIRDFGGWELFQELLGVLDQIAHRHGVSIPQVASRYVIEQTAVAAVIQGARHARHIDANVKLFSFKLEPDDYRMLDGVLARATGPKGDCYDIDRAENRDADENLSEEYYDVRDGKLVKLVREIAPLAEPYGHHLLS